MTKCLFFTLVGLSLLGCRDSDRVRMYIGAGEFLVPKDDLPKRIVEIADALERFPRKPSERDFAAVLVLAGLGRDSDWYKDQNHIWYFDDNFNRSGPQQSTYHVTVGYWPQENSNIRLFDAAIYRSRPIDTRRETIWKVEYSQ